MTAHTISDDRAIAAAADARLANARAALERAVAMLLERGVRWNLEAVITAGKGWCDEYTASLERELGRKPGSFVTPCAPKGSAFAPIVPRRPMADRGERAMQPVVVTRIACPESNLRPPPTVVMGDSGNVRAELDGDGA